LPSTDRPPLGPAETYGSRRPATQCRRFERPENVRPPIILLLSLFFLAITGTGQHFNRNSLLYSLQPPRLKEKHSRYALTE